MTQHQQYIHNEDDFAFEPVRGLPGPLPRGERMLWQGAPGFGELAIRAFHVRKVAVYFGLLIAWRAFRGMGDGVPAADAVIEAFSVLPIGLAAVGILLLLAWAYARTSVYTLTNRRLVIRSGVALPVTLNLPYARFSGAGLKQRAGGKGDLLIELVPEDHVAPMILWPHMRPWRWLRPQPMLRGIPDAAAVADLLASALKGEEPAPLSETIQQAKVGGPSPGQALETVQA
ncbi:MAG: photosynthetic complex putative assembly protein PuhB [Beijerinckiaceae bacterium]